MATPAQCYYCFECLSASFQGNEPPNLSVIEDLWEEFEASKDLALEAEPKKVTDAALAEKNLAGKGPATKPNAVDVDESDQDTQNDAMDDSEDGQKTRDLPETLQPPSIRRLQGVSSSRSSSSSEPSALSTSSSRSVLTSASSMTSAASSKSSSIFSSSKSYSENLRSETTYPLFVTWNTVSRSGQKSLRGCIGTFEPQALAPGLKSYALTSAFGDTRFSPIPASLMSSLSCSLTLLSSFENCSHAMDWELGTHGLRISFVHRGRRFGATYLPDVPTEQGWTKEETVESLMRKSGWDGTTSHSGGASRRFLRGSSNNDKPWEGVTDFKAVRYQGLKSSATYAQWQEWRRWVQSSASHRPALLES